MDADFPGTAICSDFRIIGSDWRHGEKMMDFYRKMPRLSRPGVVQDWTVKYCSKVWGKSMASHLVFILEDELTIAKSIAAGTILGPVIGHSLPLFQRNP